MKTNLKHCLPQTLQIQALKPFVRFVIATYGNRLPAAQLALKPNRTPQAGGGYYPDVTDS